MKKRRRKDSKIFWVISNCCRLDSISVPIDLLKTAAYSSRILHDQGWRNLKAADSDALVQHEVENCVSRDVSHCWRGWLHSLYHEHVVKDADAAVVEDYFLRKEKNQQKEDVQEDIFPFAVSVTAQGV